MANSGIQFFSTPRGEFSFYISKKEKLFSFGTNSHGQLSLGDVKSRNTPEEVKFFRGKNVRKVSIGYNFTLIQAYNLVYSVGENHFGQLCLGDKKNRLIPTLITCFGKRKIKDCYSGVAHSVFILENNLLFSCGKNVNGQLGIGNMENQIISKQMKINEIIEKVECGNWSTILLSKKGELYKTGEIYYGDNKYLVPTLISGFPKEEKIKAISCGSVSCLILMESKKVYGLGWNNVNFNLTREYPNSSKTPIEITNLQGIVDIKCGHVHSLVLDEKGNAFGIGNKEVVGITRNSKKSIFDKKKNEINDMKVFFLKKNIIQIESGGNQVFLFDEKKELWVGGKAQSLGLGLEKKSIFESLQKNTIIKNIKDLSENNKISFIKRKKYCDVVVKTIE